MDSRITAFTLCGEERSEGEGVEEEEEEEETKGNYPVDDIKRAVCVEYIES